MVPRYYWRQTHKADDSWDTESEEDMSDFLSTTTYGSDESTTATTMRLPPQAEVSWTTHFTRPWMESYGPAAMESTLVTSKSSLQYSTAYEGTGSPTAITSPYKMSPTSTSSSGYGNEPWGSHGNQQSSNHMSKYVAAAMVPVVLTIIGVMVFFCLKKRKKQQQVAGAQANVREMQSRRAGNDQPTVQAYMMAAAPIPPPGQSSYSAPPSHPPPPSLAVPPPVIIGPISAGSNGNYMTGIDTSDTVSVRNERTGLGDPFADGNSLDEEPPPPYRPRSIAPLSRGTSLRVSSNQQQPEPSSSQTNLLAGRNEQQQQQPPLQSPFDDPVTDDAVSELSGPTSPRNRDDMSVISDLSYQQDPTVGRSGV